MNIYSIIKETGKHSDVNQDRLVAAFELTQKDFRKQHPETDVYQHKLNEIVNITYRLSRYQGDEASMISVLLYKTNLSEENIKKDFSGEVALLVRLLRSFFQESFPLDSNKEKKTSFLKKVYKLLKKDLRLSVIVLVIRIQQLKTIELIPQNFQKQLAQETIDFYSILAKNLGILKIKTELDNLAFVFLFPEINREYQKFLEKTRQDRQKTFENVKDNLLQKDVAKTIEKMGIIEKNFVDIYRYNQNIANAKDILEKELTLKVIVPSVETCYLTLAKVHQLGRVQEREFFDHIAIPKDTGYRGLNTEVITAQNQQIRFHIRTSEMDQHSCRGIAAFVFNKNWKKQNFDFFPILKSFISNNENDLFWKNLKSDVLKEHILVFDEDKRELMLPYNATALDFAFAVNEKRVFFLRNVLIDNQQTVTLNYVLQGGEHLTCIYDQKKQLHPQWRNWVNDPENKDKILTILDSGSREDKIRKGKNLLQEEFDKYKKGYLEEINIRRLNKTTKFFKQDSFDDVLIRIAEGEFSAEEVMDAIFSKWVQKKFKVNQKTREKTVYVGITHEEDKKIMKNITDIFYRLDVYASSFKFKSIANKQKNFFEIKYNSAQINFDIIASNIKNIPGVTNFSLEFPKEEKKSYYYLLALILIWSIHPIFLHLVAQHGVSIGMSTGIRLWSAALFLFIFKIQKKTSKQELKTDYSFNYILGIMTVLLLARVFLSYYSLCFTSPTQYLIIVITSSWIINNSLNIKKFKNFSKKTLFLNISGMTIWLIGFLLLFFNFWENSDFLTTLKGNFLTILLLIAMSLFAISSNFFNEKQKIQTRSINVIGDMLLINAILFSLFIEVDWPSLLQLSLIDVILLVLAGIITSGLSNVLYLEISKYIKHYIISFATIISLFITFSIETFLYSSGWGLFISSVLVGVGLFFNSYSLLIFENNKN